MPSIVSIAEVAELGLAGREREGEIVEDQRARRKSVFADGDLVDAARDLDLALRGLRHSALVDRQRDDRGAVLARERQARHRSSRGPTSR